MTDHWDQHSIDFSSTNAEKKDNESFDFQKAEGNWDENKTGFTIDTLQELTVAKMRERRDNYAKTNPSIVNLQERRKYSNDIRNDPSYRFLMMVAAFSKKKLGTVMNVKPTKTTTTTTKDNTGEKITITTTSTEESIDKQMVDDCENGGTCELGENTGKIGGQSWMTMPEISGIIQLTPEVYGHIMEAKMIVSGFFNYSIPLKDLVETPQYQTLFARLVAIRMGLTSYFDSSEKQKDRIFSRLHKEQSMILRRISNIKTKPIRTHLERSH